MILTKFEPHNLDLPNFSYQIYKTGFKTEYLHSFQELSHWRLGPTRQWTPPVSHTRAGDGSQTMIARR